MNANNIFTISKLVSALGFVAILSTVSVAQADSFNTGFEKGQGYTVNPFNKQQGWLATTNVKVENTVVAQGKQAVDIGVIAGAFDDQYANAPLTYPIPITNRYTSVTFSFLTNNTSNSTQAGVSVIGINSSSQPYTVGQLVAGGTGISGGTFSNFILGNSNSNTLPVGFANGVWHKCILDFDFENNTVTGQVDGITLGTLTINPTTAITAVQLYNITNGNTATSDAFFDRLGISYNTGIAITP